MNQKLIRVTGSILTGALLLGSPVTDTYGAPVAGVTEVTTAEVEQEENEDPDNFIADVEILEEYRKSNRQYKAVDKIRSLFLMFMRWRM